VWAAICFIQRKVLPLECSAHACVAMVKPVLNISGRTMTSVGPFICHIFSSNMARLASASCQYNVDCTMVIARSCIHRCLAGFSSRLFFYRESHSIVRRNVAFANGGQFALEQPFSKGCKMVGK